MSLSICLKWYIYHGMAKKTETRHGGSRASGWWTWGPWIDPRLRPGVKTLEPTLFKGSFSVVSTPVYSIQPCALKRTHYSVGKWPDSGHINTCLHLVVGTVTCSMVGQNIVSMCPSQPNCEWVPREDVSYRPQRQQVSCILPREMD